MAAGRRSLGRILPCLHSAYLLQNQGPLEPWFFFYAFDLIGRDERIRTSDPHTPSVPTDRLRESFDRAPITKMGAQPPGCWIAWE